MGHSINGLWNMVCRSPMSSSACDLVIWGLLLREPLLKERKLSMPWKEWWKQWVSCGQPKPPNCGASDPSRSASAAPQKQTWVLRGQIMQVALEDVGMLYWLCLTSPGCPILLVVRLHCVALAFLLTVAEGIASYHWESWKEWDTKQFLRLWLLFFFHTRTEP